MKVRIDQLHCPESIRLHDVPLDVSGGIREPIDVLTSGEVIDGCRRVKACTDQTIEARVWPDKNTYYTYCKLLVEAINRPLDLQGEVGQTEE
jgi:hypothetical protein